MLPVLMLQLALTPDGTWIEMGGSAAIKDCKGRVERIGHGVKFV